MAREARFSAALLAGEMPQGVDAAFAAARASLFPSKADDLEATCTCPDWASPCKHVAAVHYMLGEAFDRDPFLLFELRGREKRQVIEALRAARDGDHLPKGPVVLRGQLDALGVGDAPHDRGGDRTAEVAVELGQRQFSGQDRAHVAATTRPSASSVARRRTAFSAASGTWSRA